MRRGTHVVGAPAWTGGRTLPARASVLLAVWVPPLAAVAVSPPLTGGALLPSLVFGILVGLVVLWWEGRRARRELDRPERRLLAHVISSGAPSGNQRVDRLALDRLQHDARHPVVDRAGRVIGYVTALYVVAAPLIDAVRLSLWWLLAVPSCLAFVVVSGLIAQPAAGQRRDALSRAVEPADPHDH